MSRPAWCWHTMLAISCLHCCDPARCSADSASLPLMSHLGMKSPLGAWWAPSTLPGSPGIPPACNFAAPSRLKLRLLDRSWETAPSNPAIPRSWGVLGLTPGFGDRRLLPLRGGTAAVPLGLSSLALHLPLFCPDRELLLSLFKSWLLESGSLDRLVFPCRRKIYNPDTLQGCAPRHIQKICAINYFSDVAIMRQLPIRRSERESSHNKNTETYTP